MRASLAAVLLVLLIPATASGQAIVPERVTTGPTDGGRLYTGVAASSTDGSRLIFASDEEMTPDDRSPSFDYFERVGDTTRWLTPSTGDDDQKDMMPFYGASQDAARIVFEGYGRWTADDRDGHTKDVFAAEGGRVERLSLGPGGGNAEHFDAEPAGLSADARRVLFTSYERLTPDDTDSGRDVFLREGSTTTKISPGGADADATVAGHSVDARRVVVRTLERLTAEDRDDSYDLYLRDGGSTVKLSPGDGPHDAELAALSDDGSVALVRTTESLLAADGDARSDLYRVVRGDDLRLVSAGPDDVAFDPVDMGADATYMTPDGARVAFTSYQRHTPQDTDQQLDTFLWSPDRLVKVGTGNGEHAPNGTNLYSRLDGGADDASRLVIASPERLTADDRDDRSDYFEVDTRSGAIARVTTGPNGGNDNVDIFCPFDRDRHPCGTVPFVSVDGSRIVFETRERLVPQDTDDAKDVYQRAGGVTTLLSPARAGRRADHEVHWSTGSLDGSVAYLETEEQLSADDTNLRDDGFRVRPPAPGAAGGGGGGPAGEAPTGSDVPAPLGGGGGPGASAPRLRLLARPARLRLRGGTLRLAATGAGLRFELSRAVPVSVRVERALRGRRVGRRCRPSSPSLRRRRACVRHVAVGRPVTLAARTGRQVLVPGSRLAGGRRLRAGRHRITLTPRGGAPVRISVRLYR